MTHETTRLDPPRFRPNPASTELECGCVPGHRMGVLSGVCRDCGFTEKEFFEAGNRPCDPAAVEP